MSKSKETIKSNINPKRKLNQKKVQKILFLKKSLKL